MLVHIPGVPGYIRLPIKQLQHVCEEVKFYFKNEQYKQRGIGAQIVLEDLEESPNYTLRIKQR